MFGQNYFSSGTPFNFQMPDVHGALVAGLGSLTRTSTGTVLVSSSLSVALGALSGISAGTVAVTGSASITLGSLAVSSSGHLMFAQAAITFSPMTLSAAAQDLVSASLNQTLGMRKNWIFCSSGATAVVGSPGTMPAQWSLAPTSVNGVTLRVAAVGTTADGVGYCDIQVLGTATAAFNVFGNLNTAGVIPAILGQTLTESGYFGVAAGALGDAVVRLCGQYQNVPNTASAGPDLVGPPLAVTGTFQRFSVDASPTSAVAGWIMPYWKLSCFSGTTYNLTLRIGGFQLENGPLSPYIQTTTGPVTVYDSLKATASATVSNAAALAQALGSLVSSAAATVGDTAALAKTLGSLTAVAASAVGNTAVLSKALGALTESSTATVGNAAVLSKALGPLTLSASSTGIVQVVLSKALGAMTAVGRLFVRRRRMVWQSRSVVPH